MFSKYKFPLFLLLLALVAIALLTVFLDGKNIAILNPKGVVATEERNLMVFATLLMLTLAIPVFIALFVFAWKYRVKNTDEARHMSDRGDRGVVDFVWWIPPSIVIFILAVITWQSTHTLDPSKPIVSNVRPLTVQVVALRWKWLFIYPEQNIATVNFVEFPEDTPINFELTADAPMNSFWIPQLGGQMYAMSGMSTQLHLMADEVGDFQGSAAEISGSGFAGMKFVARATSQSVFEEWVQSIKQSGEALTIDTYNKLAEPSVNNSPVFYSSTEEGLYNRIVMKFMAPNVSVSYQKEKGHY